MTGFAQNHPSSIFRVLNVNIRHNVSWHPETPDVRGDAEQVAAFKGSSSTGKQMQQPSPEVSMELTTEMPPTTQQPERTWSSWRDR